MTRLVGLAMAAVLWPAVLGHHFRTYHTLLVNNNNASVLELGLSSSESNTREKIAINLQSVRICDPELDA